MNSESSNISLELPTVPTDFNGGKGVEFAQALVQFLSSTRVVGLPTDQAASMDFAAIQQSINEIRDQLDLTSRKFRHVIMTGVTDAELWVPFSDMGTTQYAAWATPVIPLAANPGTFTVHHIEGTKATDQCKFRIDGAGAAYKFEFYFLEYKDA